MKILITGGCGFIGSYAAEKFAKEGHSVYIIDNLSSGMENTLKSAYKFYNINITDKRCEEIFRIHNFDIVVHLADQQDDGFSADGDAYSDSETTVLGLVNMLDLSCKYRVKKFIFTSSAAVYGNKTDFPVQEDAPLTPVSIYGANKAVGEYYCRQWQEMYGLDTVILRLANVYGPGYASHNKPGTIANFIKNIIDQNDIVIYGEAAHTRDYIHVEEVSYIIYQIAVKDISEKVVNISTNTEVSFEELLEKLALLEPVKNIRYEKKKNNDIARVRLDNSILAQKLNWQPKQSLGEGLRQTYEWYKKSYIKPAAAKKGSKIKKARDVLRPYLENISIFSLLWFANFGGYFSFIDSRLGIDYNYVYITVMGFLYGKKQSMIAMALSSVLFTANFLLRGGDWVALIYQSQYLFHLATYLCVGVLTGFAIDNKDRIIKDVAQEIDSLKDRHEFLEKIHLEANQIKDNLYGQIVNTEDSIGRVYSIVHKLDTLEMEKIYTAATDIVRNIMNAEFAVLYTVNKYETYLRLKTKVGEAEDCFNSMKIEEHPYLQNLMTSKQVYINKALTENCPDMAAPILYQGRIFAILQVHGLPFGNFTLFHENLFRITTMFITDALIKAHLYTEGIKDKSYVKNTNILVPEEFNKVCQEVENRRQLFKQSMALLKITEKPNDYEALSEKISHLFRGEDFIGLKENGHVYILLINIIEGTVAKVQNRLNNIDIAVEVEMESLGREKI